MPNMPEKLCDVCLDEGRASCPFQKIIKRVEAIREGAKDLSVTPSPLGGNDEMAKWLQGVTAADNADLLKKAEERRCPVVLAAP